jgi:hypothetical protein
MVKTPKARHSRPQKEPMTIDLSPDAVSRIDDEEKSAAESAEVFESGGAGEESVAAGENDEASSNSAEPAAQPSDSASDQFIGSEWPPEPQAAQPASVGDFGRGAAAETAAEPPATGGMDRDSGAPLAPPPSARRGSSLVGGLVGGAIALLGVGGLQVAGFWPGSGGGGSDGEAVAALQAELATLMQDIAGLKAAPGPDTSALETAMADWAARVETLGAAVDQLKADLEALKAAPGGDGGVDAAALAAINAKIATLEQAIAALSPGGVDTTDVATLSGRVDAVETATRAAADKAAAVEGKLADLEASIAGLAGQIQTIGDQPKVALALAGAALKAALDRGGTFVSEVETFAAIVPDAPELPALREAAAKGVASRQMLVAESEAAAEAMIAAGDVADPNAGFFDRLWDSLTSLVSVRPIGAVEGEGVPETVARMEQAVKDGDLAKAVAEYDALPDVVKTAGSDFAGKVRARLDAEQLVDKALAGAAKAA